MNYLSHFTLHRQENRDNFFTVGLTLPDIVGFFRRVMRVNEKSLLSLDLARLTSPAISTMVGMIIHYRIDRWFHRSDFFKESTSFLQTEFTKITGEKITRFHVHILLEILIDRYLLSQDPSLAHDFYSSWQSCDWEATLPLFEHNKKFSIADYLQSVSNFGYSKFLGEYLDYSKIRVFLNRFSDKVKYKRLTPLPDSVFVAYFEHVYEFLLPSIVDCLSEARSLDLSKEKIMKGLPCPKSCF